MSEIGDGPEYPQQPPQPQAQPAATAYTHAAWPGQQPPQTGHRHGMPTWAKVLIGVGAAGVIMVILMCSGILYLGMIMPETRALAGSQLTKRNVDTIRRLGLLEEGERIKYFYSDGMLSIEEGMYFFTDEKIVCYGKGLDPQATVVAFEDVADISADFSDTWLVDGTIWVELADGTPVVMPISAERGVDELFYDALVKTWENRQQAASAP
jgi:hypothetical protein